MGSLAVVTGASSGIGLEFARQLAARGNNLLLISRDGQELKKVADKIAFEFGVTADYLSCDLSDRKDLNKLIAHINRLRVDVLINNAGIGDYADFVDADINKIESMLELNIMALVKITHCVLPKMVKNNRGKILNVASTAAFYPGPKMASYYASKSFVLSFSEALSCELEDTKVTVTALCPGPTATKFGSTANATKSPLFKAGAKLASAEDVVAYGIHAMDQGKAIAVSGGWLTKILIQVPRVLPRSTTAKLIKKAQSNRD